MTADQTPRGAIVVDGNAIGYASQHSSPLSHNGKPMQAVLGFVNQMRTLQRNNPGADLLVLWDTTAQWRYDIYPQYKGKRAVTPKQIEDRAAYKSQMPLIQQLTTLLGIPQVKAEGFEADDLAGFFVRRSNRNKRPITLVTGDQDWLQLVDARHIRWFDPRRDGKWVGHEKFHQLTGSPSPTEFLLMKAAMGDASDNIEGIEGLGPKCADNITEVFGGVSGLWRHRKDQGKLDKSKAPQGLNTRFIKPMNRVSSPAGLKTIKRNLTLMNLRTSGRDRAMHDLLDITPGNADEDLGSFFSVCLDHDFASVISRREIWTNTFSKGETT